MKPIKQKKCRICKSLFTPFSTTAVVCSPPCALDLNDQRKAKKERQETRKKRQELKTKSDWLKEAQYECNKYIRLRDSREPCISCGRFHAGQYHASHYRSVGAHPELRFNEWNIHKACSVCNNHKSGNIVEYRINLVKKIGTILVEWLEGPHLPKKYTIDEIKAIKLLYREKCKQLLGLQKESSLNHPAELSRLTIKASAAASCTPCEPKGIEA